MWQSLQTRKLWSFFIVVAATLLVATVTRGVATTAPAPSPACQQLRLNELKVRADHGSATAQNRLAGLYLQGLCVPQDAAQAVHWYTQSAQQGNADSQFQLAMLLVDGNGVGQSYTQAASWLRRAAEQDEHRAQYALGALYVRGLGLPKDLEHGYKWIRISAPPTDPRVHEVLAALAKSMSSSEVARAEAAAARWIENYRRVPFKAD